MVGSESRVLTVHSNHLVSASPVFKAAVSQHWQEGKTNVITLPEDEPDIVNLYLNFVYTDTLPCRVMQGPYRAGDEDSETTALAKLYVFGEKYQDHRLKVAVINAIFALSETSRDDGFTWYLTSSDIDVIYKGTLPGSPAGQLMVEQHAHHGTVNWLHHETNNAEFLLDLDREFMRLKDEDEEKNENDNENEELTEWPKKDLKRGDFY